MEQNAETARIQVMGRSLLSHLQQLFRNADLFEQNNQIFGKLAGTMANYVAESFKMFGGCSLRINAHQVFIEDNRVFVDAGMIESVNFLTMLFTNAEIGGLAIQQECTDADILLKSLFALRETIINEKSKGAEAIKRALSRHHYPYLLPLAHYESQSTMTGIRDVENARKFALRNATKLLLYLQDFVLTVEKDEPPRMNILYRVVMNLMRINELYPNLVLGLLYFPIRDPLQRQMFQSIVLLLAVGRELKLERRTQIDLCVASAFQRYGYLTIPTVVRNSPRLAEYTSTVAIRGAKKILESRFINRALYLRLVTTWQMPLQANPLHGPGQVCPFVKLLRTISFLLSQWQPGQEQGALLHEATQKLLQSQDANLDKPFLLLIAHVLGFYHPGQPIYHHMGKPLVVAGAPKDLETILELCGLIKDPISGYERLRFNLADPAQYEAQLRQLRFVRPGERRPNSIKVLY